MNAQLQSMFQIIIQAFQINDYQAVTSVLEEILQKNADHSDFVFELGITYAKLNKFNEASLIFCHLLSHKKSDLKILYNLGLIYSLQGRQHLALETYNQALKIKPDDVEILINMGASYNDIENYVLALEVLEKAIRIRPDIPEAWSNKGIALNNLNFYEESICAYEKAIKLNPRYHEALSNKSVPLIKLKRLLEADEICNKALSLKPDYAEGWSNKGLVLNELKRYDEAIIHFDKALSLKPDYAEGWSNKGLVLSELKRYDEAIIHFDKALSLKPDIDWIYGDLLHTKLKICNWSNFSNHTNLIYKKINAKKRVSQPFNLLALSDDALLHKKCSELFIQSKFLENTILPPLQFASQKKKLRIGYFSSDFKLHPVAFLIAELIEIHDRNNFEIYAFSLTDTSDEMNIRLRDAFDSFIDVANQSDIEIAQLTRKLNIDIAVDLTGLTNDSRAIGIFAHRAAPIQVNYLGYPGTTGVNFIDYIIADKNIIPPKFFTFYTEKVVHLPNTYQVNDRKRPVTSKYYTRQELKLPHDRFIFCCFNNNYKILPTMFASWMRILNSVEGSVLWLLEDNPLAARNLKIEAEKQNVRAERLIFAERLPLADHLSRHLQADLFLDTFPYNAHTTASDALWTGLPVITMKGQSFASRVAASLLNAIELPELITDSQEAYEALAISLATNPQKLATIKETLKKNILTASLFNTPLFTKNLESAYIKIYERYITNLEPGHIAIN